MRTRSPRIADLAGLAALAAVALIVLRQPSIETNPNASGLAVVASLSLLGIGRALVLASSGGGGRPFARGYAAFALAVVVVGTPGLLFGPELGEAVRIPVRTAHGALDALAERAGTLGWSRLSEHAARWGVGPMLCFLS